MLVFFVQYFAMMVGEILTAHTFFLEGATQKVKTVLKHLKEEMKAENVGIFLYFR